MRRGGKDCCRVRLPAFLAFLLLLHGALGSTVAAEVAQQATSAEAQVVPGAGTFGAVPALAAPDAGAWKPTPLPFVLPRAGSPAGDPAIDTAWIRVAVPPAVQALPPGTGRLYVPRWQTIGHVAVYLDGRLAYRSTAGPVWNGFNHPLWLPLGNSTDAAAPREVLIRIDHQRSAGAALSTVWLGDAAGLARSRWLRELVQAGLPQLASATFLVIGAFALLVWVARRELEYGLFFLASVFFALRSMHYYLGLEPLPIPEAWFGWLTVHSLVGVVITVNIFGLRLHGRRYPRIEWPLIAVALLAAAASMPGVAVWRPVAALAPGASVVLLAGFVALSALGLWSAWRARSADSLIVIGMNSCSLPAAVHDLLLQNYQLHIERVYLLPLMVVALYAAYLLVVVRRYLGALRRSEQAQQVLEEQLRAREAELTASHARLRVVEHEQILSRERQRLMQDMHDGLGSSLMGALKAVEHGHEEDLAGILRECIDDLKLAIDSLEPVQADLLLLLATLRYRLGTRLEQSGLRLHWEVQDVPPLPWLDPQSALHILRILQEVLVNATKHGQARSVTLTTQLAGERVLVAVHDDGCGFEPSRSGGGGRGLANVRRRANDIGAQVRWVRDQGTRFELELPLVRAAQPAGAAPGWDAADAATA